MICQHYIDCPQCLYLKAVHFRERNSLATRLECPKCGLDREYRLPEVDALLARGLFDDAKRRVAVGSLKQWLRRLAIPMMYVLAVGIYFQDAKLVSLLFGMMLAFQISSAASSIRQQLAYVLRLNHPSRVGGDFVEISSDDPSASDVVHDYEVAAGALGEEGVRRLDNRYYAYVRWLATELQTSGCDKQTIDSETIRFTDHVDKLVKARITHPLPSVQQQQD